MYKEGTWENDMGEWKKATRVREEYRDARTGMRKTLKREGEGREREVTI
jgi:hypothetical protein